MKLITRLALFFTWILSLSIQNGFAEEVLGPAAQLANRSELLIIAHRGASQLAPENTIPAFEKAIEDRADLIELDYYHSVDGKLVVIHDKDLDRTTDAESVLGVKKQAVEKTTWAQFDRLDAGGWFGAKFKGTKIPTLEQSLDSIQQGSVTLIERKGGDAKTVVELLRQKKLVEEVIVQGFDWKYVKACHELEPALTLGALGSKEITKERLDEIEKTGAKIVVWKSTDLEKSDIDQIHHRGFRAWCYTVNDAAETKRLLTIGIDGIITDDPGKLRSIVKEIKQK